jgi:predicted P-loop ATPase
MDHLAGIWIVELAELSAMTKAETTTLKHFLTKQEDYFRPAYGRMKERRPRQCVFIGSTNSQEYLRDETGGRRFWPMQCGSIDLDGLARDRDQLLAEAVAAYRRGAKWWPDRGFEAAHIQPEQDARYTSDVWAEDVAFFVRDKTAVRVSEILRDALDMPKSRQDALAQKRITSILQRLGWRRVRSHGVKKWLPPC